jgi:hypothetical protein
METMMEKWDLWDYFDVWGNEQDGWEVNDQTRVQEGVIIDETINNDDIIQYLVQCGFLKRGVTADDFYILWDCEGFIEIYEKESGKPLYCFRKQYF